MAIRKINSRSIGTDIIVAEDIAANAITVSEISDGAVTPAKLSTGSPSWNTDGNVALKTSSASTYAAVGFTNANNATPAWIGLKGDQTNSLSFYVASNISPSNTYERMRINSNGYVSIGLGAADASAGVLHVEGNAGAGTGTIAARPVYGAGTYYNAFRAAPADGSSTGGLFIGSLQKSNALITSGAYYDNAGTWKPADTTASGISLSGGWINFMANQSLTVGTAYTPITRTQIAPNGTLYHYAENYFNGTRRLTLSPGVWRISRSSIAGLFDLEFKMGSTNYSLGTDQPRVLRTVLAWRYATGWAFNTYVSNTAFAGSTANYSSNGVGLCVTNAQNGSIDIQIHNSYSQAVTAMYCVVEINGVNTDPADLTFTKITEPPSSMYSSNPY